MLNITTELQAYGYRPLLKSETILVEGLKRTSFPLCSLGIVPEGQEGRQKFQGPMVPGPWGFATTHANVIDNSGCAAKERREAIKIHVGQPFTVDGLPGTWMLRSPKPIEGDGATLVEFDAEHPEAVEYAGEDE